MDFAREKLPDNGVGTLDSMIVPHMIDRMSRALCSLTGSFARRLPVNGVIPCATPGTPTSILTWKAPV